MNTTKLTTLLVLVLLAVTSVSAMTAQVTSEKAIGHISEGSTTPSASNNGGGRHSLTCIRWVQHTYYPVSYCAEYEQPETHTCPLWFAGASFCQ